MDNEMRGTPTMISNMGRPAAFIPVESPAVMNPEMNQPRHPCWTVI